jgi:hypothetical protein
MLKQEPQKWLEVMDLPSFKRVTKQVIKLNACHPSIPQVNFFDRCVVKPEYVSSPLFN